MQKKTDKSFTAAICVGAVTIVTICDKTICFRLMNSTWEFFVRATSNAHLVQFTY